MQQALAAFSGRGNGKDAQNIVPAPPSKASDYIVYDQTYTLNFKKPTPYIAFSETVENTIACRYDMNSEDDVWLKGYNSKRPANSQCDEDVFERYMEYFEIVADTEAPFAALDQTIVPLDTMELNIKADLPRFDQISVYFKDIYEYWKTRRQCSSNRSLQPSLKFEVHQEADDSDPYVCFRRRDVRLPRKTRGRDQNAQDKLKKLRLELEEGRLLVLNWEQSLKDQQRATRHNRKIFQKRAEIRDMRCRLGLSHNDEDLVNQKVSCSARTTVHFANKDSLRRRNQWTRQMPEYSSHFGNHCRQWVVHLSARITSSKSRTIIARRRSSYRKLLLIALNNW